MFSKQAKRFTFYLLLVSMALLLFASVSQAAIWRDSKCGVVEDSARGTYVLRNDKWIELKNGSEIYEFESVSTNSTGRATIRLIDDTVIEMSANSVVHIAYAEFTADHATLQLFADKGNIRFTTGSIGLKKPRGIKFVTRNNAYVMSNCVLDFSLQPDKENVLIEWMPAGQKIEIFNMKDKTELIANDEVFMITTTDAEGVVFQVH